MHVFRSENGYGPSFIGFFPEVLPESSLELLSWSKIGVASRDDNNNIMNESVTHICSSFMVEMSHI